MFPVIFEFPEWLPLIGGKALHTYGLLVATGFLVGIFWVKRESVRVGLNPQKMVDLFFYVVLVAIVGSRLYYVFVSVPHWWEDPLVFIRFWEGGLVFYGGLIAAVVTNVWYCRKNRLPFFAVADVYAPGIALGHAFGRIGCFFAGCCYGREAPANSLFAVIFPDTKYSIAPYDHPVYATQLFEFASELVIFLVLFLFRKRKKFDGEVFLVYIILYPVTRIFLEMFRGDKVRGFLIEGVVSNAQVVSFIWVVLATTLWIMLKKKAGKKSI